MELITDNLPLSYADILQKILSEGDKVSPRGKLTYEISPFLIRSTNPRKRFFAHPFRDANPIFPLAELLWFFQARDDLEMIRHYNARMAEYVNPFNNRFNGAYGPRLFNYMGQLDQISAVYSRLKADRDTRRAIAVIYNPMKDHVDSLIDVPCNIILHFMIRKDKLNLTVYVRSQDTLRGFCYDSVSEDAVIALSDRQVRVRDLFNEYESHKEGELNVVHTPDLTCLSVSQTSKTAQTIEAAVSKIIEHDVDKEMYEIETESGRRVIVTKDHSMLKKQGSAFVAAKPSELKIGDELPCL